MPIGFVAWHRRHDAKHDLMRRPLDLCVSVHNDNVGRGGVLGGTLRHYDLATVEEGGVEAARRGAGAAFHEHLCTLVSQ